MSKHKHHHGHEMFVSQAELDLLATKLDTIGDLVVEMAVALTGQAVNLRSQEAGHSQPRSKEPYPSHISVLRDTLHNELGATIRALCEYRGIEYDGGVSWPAQARWIRNNRLAIGFMEDGPEMWEALCGAIDRCNSAVNRNEVEYVIDSAKLAKANRMIVTAGHVERMAHKLGAQGKGLTRKRIESLRRRGILHGWQDGDKWFYRMGDVLKAHRDAKVYKPRKSKAS